MVKGSREVIAGMIRLQEFPPAILFGLGGIFAEVLQDSAVRLAPFDRLEALRQIDSIQAADFLGPIRGMVPADKEALADLLVGLGLLSVQFPEIREIDLNPIVIAEGKPIVVDALFVR
jgi:acyl-CoA synthetase (NDP forming)